MIAPSAPGRETVAKMLQRISETGAVAVAFPAMRHAQNTLLAPGLHWPAQRGMELQEWE
jgi:hypothetical protein